MCVKAACSCQVVYHHARLLLVYPLLLLLLLVVARRLILFWVPVFLFPLFSPLTFSPSSPTFVFRVPELVRDELLLIRPDVIYDHRSDAQYPLLSLSFLSLYSILLLLL